MKTCKDIVFQKLYSTNGLTAKSIELMIFLLSRCDVNGRISVYHRDIERAVGITENTFYRILSLLESKEITYTIENKEVKTHFIVKEPKNRKYKDEICLSIPFDNFNVSELCDDKNKNFDRYVNLDYECFKPEFLDTLSLAELRVFLYFFFRCYKTGDIVNGCAEFKSKTSAYIAISKNLGIKPQSVRKAIAKLCKKYILNFDCSTEYDSRTYTYVAKIRYSLDYYITKPIYTIISIPQVNKYTGEHITQIEETTTTYRADKHTIRNLLRRAKKREVTSEQDINDIAIIFNMYKKAAKAAKETIEDVVARAIAQCKIIKANIIHKLIRDILFE